MGCTYCQRELAGGQCHLLRRLCAAAHPLHQGSSGVPTGAERTTYRGTSTSRGISVTGLRAHSGGAALAVAPPKQSGACIPCSVTESRQPIVSDTITQNP